MSLIVIPMLRWCSKWLFKWETVARLWPFVLDRGFGANTVIGHLTEGREADQNGLVSGQPVARLWHFCGFSKLTGEGVGCLGFGVLWPTRGTFVAFWPDRVRLAGDPDPGVLLVFEMALQVGNLWLLCGFFYFPSSLEAKDPKANSRAAYGLMLKRFEAYSHEQALAFEETSRMVAHDLIHGTGKSKRGRGRAKSTRVSGNAQAPQPRPNRSGLGDGDELDEADPSPAAATGEQALGGVPNVAEEPSSRAQEHTAESAKESARAQGHEFARELMLSGALSVYTGKK